MNDYEFKLTPAYCLFNGAAVIHQHGAEITFMVENPDDEMLQTRLEKAFSQYLENVCKNNDCPEIYKRIPKIEFITGTRIELRKAVSELYESKNPEQNENDELELTDFDSSQKDDEAAAVLLLDSILHEARQNNATDIHIEKNSIKYRVKGKLNNQIVLQKDKASELIQRIKLLSGMNVIEKRRSQDGHFIYGETKPLFIRVSTMAVIGNNREEMEESVVLRILDTSRIPLAISQLGYSFIQYEGIKTLCKEKNGLIIICGPTGAGKSTTAASMLLEIQRENNDSLKIISMEDPPEYLISGITQIQIDEGRHNSYEDALQHVFRQDPDVIMIGEIRDENSAKAAIRASLTGHLVIATLHTGSAAGSILRLENLGIGRKIIGSVIKGVIVQDLNYTNGTVQLIADLALPVYSFAADLKAEMAEIEIEKLFDHMTNFSEVFQKTFNPSNKKKLVPIASMPTLSKQKLRVKGA